jgi:hypothetical protein
LGRGGLICMRRTSGRACVRLTSRPSWRSRGSSPAAPSPRAAAAAARSTPPSSCVPAHSSVGRGGGVESGVGGRAVWGAAVPAGERGWPHERSVIVEWLERISGCGRRQERNVSGRKEGASSAAASPAIQCFAARASRTSLRVVEGRCEGSGAKGWTRVANAAKRRRLWRLGAGRFAVLPEAGCQMAQGSEPRSAGAVLQAHTSSTRPIACSALSLWFQAERNQA